MKRNAVRHENGIPNGNIKPRTPLFRRRLDACRRSRIRATSRGRRARSGRQRDASRRPVPGSSEKIAKRWRTVSGNERVRLLNGRFARSFQMDLKQFLNPNNGEWRGARMRCVHKNVRLLVDFKTIVWARGAESDEVNSEVFHFPCYIQ